MMAKKIIETERIEIIIYKMTVDRKTARMENEHGRACALILNEKKRREKKTESDDYLDDV